jgi:hypothetical protein
MRNIRMMAITAIAVTVAVSAWAADGVWYVDKDNESGVQDGLSWSTAYTTIQPAIDAAFEDGGGEVWVGEGVYNEIRFSPDDDGVDTGSLVLRDNVAVYGGFAAIESTRQERDPLSRITVVDGSGARGQQAAIHVIVASGEDTLVDGLHISGGNANGEKTRAVGGGIYLTAGPLVIAGCSVTGNRANSGGGLYGREGPVSIMNSAFRSNSATAIGGACTLSGLHGYVYSSEFTNNTANASAAVYSTRGFKSYDRASLTLRRCIFDHNAASSTRTTNVPSVAYCNGDASITNSIFYSNTSAADEGETLLFVGPSDPEAQDWPTVELTNCTFYGNNDSARDAAIRYEGSVEWTLRNCIIVEHRGWAIQGGGAPGQLLYSDIQGPLPWPTSGPDQPRFLTVEGLIDRDPDFSDAENGDFRLRSFSPCIDTGTAEGAPDEDINGVSRPQGEGVDMGAYETGAFNPRMDVYPDGKINALDVQLVINGALGVSLEVDTDVTGDMVTNALDVQLVINAALWFID